jgi:hypothetical protein
MPSGPVACTAGVARTFTVTTAHPFDDSMWFQFDWGDTIGDWGGPVAHDSVFGEKHAFDSAGTFGVKARARDAHGGTSPWSEPLEVSVAGAEPPAKPDVSCTAINAGANLWLYWTAVAAAEFYEIATDDSAYVTTATSFVVSTPTARIEVRAANGSGKSDPATVDCGVVEDTVEFFGDLDPTHDNGFSFGEDGTAVGCTLKYSSMIHMDFYANGVSGGMKLVSGGTVNFNRLGNQLKAASGNYDDITIADPLGTYSDSSLAITVDSTCYLRVSADSTGTWSTEDNFAKANVVSIQGERVTLKTAYQRIGGLRWLKSD